MSRVFTVEATRSGKWWVLEEPDVGAVSQVRSLSEVDQEMREAIAYLSGLPEQDVTIETRIILPKSVADEIAQVELLRETSREANAAAAKRSRELVRGLRESGLTFTDIGRVLGISRGRASQLAKQ